METIYEKAVRLVSLGCPFRVNLRERTLKINKNVVFNGNNESIDLEHKDFETCTKELLELYWRYRHSVPTSRSMHSRAKRYFIPLNEEELTSEDFMCGETRDIARLKLELTLLLMICNGDITWDKITDNPKHYFWKPSADDDFVILKSWIA